MNQYSVLLVDDEEFVFEVMMKKIKWEEIGFQVTGYAKNGLEALEMAEENLPDVVLTDIKMPYMDGLTLCRKLKEQYPDIKVIILSGFDEFEYAKEAISLEVEEYLLKPIDADELVKVFSRVHESLDREISERSDINKLQEAYLNSLPLLQENFYVSLLAGRIRKEELSKYALDYQISLTGPLFVVCIFHVSSHGKNGEDMEIAPYMLSISVRNLVEEQFKGRWNYKALNYLDNLVVVMQLENKGALNRLTDHCDRICKMAKRVCKAVVTAGIGYLVDVPEEIPDSYTGARNAVSHRVMYGTMRAININEVEMKRSAESLLPEVSDPHAIVKAIRLGNPEELEIQIRKFAQEICGREGYFRNYQVRLMKLSVELMEFMGQYELNTDEVFLAKDNFMEEFFECDSEETLIRFLTDKCMKILRMAESRRQDTRTSFVVAAEEYVKENYADKNLDIDAVCSFLNVSSSYFSTTFKKDTGKTFISYLTDFRMERAALLLEQSELKTYEVAEKVGYADPNYFSYAFKKKFGVSPSKYLAGIRKKQQAAAKQG